MHITNHFKFILLTVQDSLYILFYKFSNPVIQQKTKPEDSVIFAQLIQLH
jgi:hypothetical protein